MLPKFLCSKCGQYDFTTLNDLETHIVKMHFCSPNALYKCWFASCNKQFPTEVARLQHMYLDQHDVHLEPLMKIPDEDFVSLRMAIYDCLSKSIYQTFSRLTESNGNISQGPTTAGQAVDMRRMSLRKRARIFENEPIQKEGLDTTAHQNPAQSSSDPRQHNFCGTNDEGRKSPISSKLTINLDSLNESVNVTRSMPANSSLSMLRKPSLENFEVEDENNERTEQENAQRSCVVTAGPSLVNVFVTANPALSNNVSTDQKIEPELSSKSFAVKDEPIDELAEDHFNVVFPDHNDSFPPDTLLLKKAKFSEEFFHLVKQKQYIHLPSSATYDSILAAFAKRRNGEKLDKSSDFHYLNRYRLVESDGTEKLYRGHQEVVKQEEVFDVLHDAHMRLGHPGRDKMCKELKGYFGLTQQIVQLYLSLCKVCELKKSKAKKPILSNNFNDRCQVDLIDLQARPDGEYKFLMVYQDHLTKFVVLKALTHKSAAEVVSKWPQCKIVHGKPRHSQSQGSVERANGDIGDILIMHLREEKSTAWASALHVVQAAKNSRWHRGIGRSPYEAMFGRKMIATNMCQLTAHIGLRWPNPMNR
ncbi:KRAB-A domain-containing protein 2 [Ditylenchus destructor]|nr:KRAB-A domain-containing protein 2 [Ditylenchus destructor]